MRFNNLRKIIYKLPNISRKIRFCFYKPYNRFLFKIVGIKYGNNLNVFNKIYLNIENDSTIQIGDNFYFTSGDSINPLSRNIQGCIHATKGSKIKIGNNVGISSACLRVKESLSIGNNVKIGGDCIILDTDAHSLDYRIRRSKDKDVTGQFIDSAMAVSKPIIIEDDVLIGTRCIILKGVTIGARSIIGSGSVVTKSIPADCIAGGNPCKIIKYINN